MYGLTDDKLDEEKANRWGWGLQDDYFTQTVPHD